MPSSGGARRHPHSKPRWWSDEEIRWPGGNSSGKPAGDGLQDGEAIVTTTPNAPTDAVCETCGGRLRYAPARPEYGLEAKALHYIGDSKFVSERCPGVGREVTHAE